MKVKRVLAAAMAVSMAFSLAACGKSGGDEDKGGASTDVTIDQIKLGEDYTDIKADLKMLTHRTDIVDTKFKEYLADFQEMYPDINVEFEAIANYAEDTTTRLSTGDWGDICMIPTTVDKDELSNYFISYGTQDKLSEIYVKEYLNNFTYQGETYGIPSMANASGVVYNKKVFEEAGIKEIPKTPDEFIEALKMIKDNTDAIPLYTNFAAGWTMSAWDAYIDGSANGDPDYWMNGLTKGKDPFSDRGDGTGPYAVYSTLYNAVSEGLTEDDPTTTDWEGSKGMINRGEIGCMVLGSWSIPQMQQAGDNGDDIAYMPFPITVDGKQYASSGPDYNYGINRNSTEDEQIAAMCFVKYMVEETGLAQEDGGVSPVIGAELPSVLSDFEGIELIVNSAAPEGEETLQNDVNNDSELGLNVSGECATSVIENAVTGEKSMEELANEWNEKWTAAQENNGITQ